MRFHRICPWLIVPCALAVTPTASFDIPGAKSIRVTGLNNRGQVSGTYSDSSGSHGFLRNVDGTLISFDAPGGTLSTGDINDAGTIVGRSGNNNAFLRNPDGTFVVIQPPSGEMSIWGEGINNSGQIVGSYGGNYNVMCCEHGFIRSADGMTITTVDVGCVPFTYPASINNAGLVAGIAPIACPVAYHFESGFIRSANGLITLFNPPNSFYTLVGKINNLNQVVGSFQDVAQLYHGYIRSADGNSYTIFDYPGATNTYLTGINDSGQLAGWYDVKGVSHGFAPAYTLSLSHGKLNFAYSGTFITHPQPVLVNFSGGVNLAWTASSDQPSIIVSPSSGNGNGALQITAAAGSSGVVTVTAPGAVNSPQQIQVNVRATTPNGPTGSFDTPIDNTTGVAGAIPVTGWALSNIEVTKVDIWREGVGSEPANQLFYIGDAVLVSGARPDVEAYAPDMPWQFRAGWGYLLLTNFLPSGNGTFKLHAIAHDLSGLQTDLGSKIIAVDNAHAAKPFGTIDTPTQGGSASGTQFVNFGWALTQNPYCIPTDGSTITVYVDGVAQPGHPTYNNNRSDIATLFPNLCNSNGAIGYYSLDTSQLTNGVHIVSWTVYDNNNRGDGIGSRYFNVFNSSAPASEAPPDLPVAATENDHRYIRPDQNGVITLDVGELERIELPLGAASGYLHVNGERALLPTGSSLKAGVFYWDLGAGFNSEYSLVFDRPGGSQIQVRVRVRPKF